MLLNLAPCCIHPGYPGRFSGAKQCELGSLPGPVQPDWSRGGQSPKLSSRWSICIPEAGSASGLAPWMSLFWVALFSHVKLGSVSVSGQLSLNRLELGLSRRETGHSPPSKASALPGSREPPFSPAWHYNRSESRPHWVEFCPGFDLTKWLITHVTILATGAQISTLERRK